MSPICHRHLGYMVGIKHGALSRETGEANRVRTGEADGAPHGQLGQIGHTHAVECGLNLTKEVCDPRFGIDVDFSDVVGPTSAYATIAPVRVVRTP